MMKLHFYSLEERDGMRIIDKNTDFYDYIQYMWVYDDSSSFDRTDSFLLTKAEFCEHLHRASYYGKTPDYNFVLLQVCNTFWLFLIKIEKIEQNKWGTYYAPTDYSVELLKTWKNYNKARCAIKLDIIDFSYEVRLSLYKHTREWSFESLIRKIDDLVQAIDTNNYSVKENMNNHTYISGDGTKTEKHIPILKACGLSEYIQPMHIYSALDEYISMEKQASERTSSVGITDKEKIENHGFDTKTSFRGK